MVNVRSNRPNRGGIGRATRHVLLFVLALVLVVPGISHAEATISKAETRDSNNDGRLDQIVVTLSEAPTAWAAADFQVEAGYRPVLTVEQSPSDAKVFTLTITPKSTFDTGAKPIVSYKGESATPADKAAPILVAAWGDDHGGASVFNAVGDMVRLQFSEPITLNTTGPSGELVAPAVDTADRLLALERGVVIGGPSGCGTDGDGTMSVGTNSITPKRNFPHPSAGAGSAPGADIDPVTNVAGVITVRQKAGNDGSGTGYRFNITPESVAAHLHCTAGVSATLRNSFTDSATNAAAQRAGGAALINHVKGELVAAPETVDANANGKIDGVALSFNHPAKFDSITRALGGSRLAIGSGSVAAENLRCDACVATPTGSASVVTISFDEIAAWSTAATPAIAYDDSGDCAGTGIQVVLVNGLPECAGSFAQTSVDKARPVIVQAKTRDLGDDPLNAAPNGKLDAVEATFSEPVADSTFISTGSGWAVTGYFVNGFHTGTTANDAVVLLRFSEVGVDTANTANVSYTQPGAPGDVKVADANGNQLSNIAAPGVNASDGAGPVIVAGSVLDAAGDPDGRIDTARFTFSEAVLDAPIAPAKFRVGAGSDERSATSTEFDAVADARLVTAIVSGGVAGTDSKDLSVQAGAVFDVAGNGAPALRLASTNVQDLAKPVLVGVTPSGQNANAVPVTLTWSEKMDLNVAPTVKYGLAEPYADTGITAATGDAYTNGYRKDDPTKWEGTAGAPEGGSDACLDPTGCVNRISVANAKGQDTADSAYAPDTRYSWTIDTVAPAFAPAITSPSNGGSVATSGATANVVVSGTSSEPGLTIEVYEGDTLRGSATSDGSHNWTATLPAMTLGAHALKTRAVDAGGNATAFSGLRTVYVKRTTSLTIGRNVSTLVYGYGATFSGVLRDAGGAAIQNRLVSLQYLPTGTSSWRHVASVRTSSSGVWAFTYKPLSSGYFRAVYGGESTLMNATSPVTFLPVRVSVSSAQSATSIRYGSTVTFTGTVQPRHAGKRVYLQILNSNGSWSNLTYTYLDRYSNYKFVYKPTSRSTRYYRVFYYKQDADHYEFWSSTRRVTAS